MTIRDYLVNFRAYVENYFETRYSYADFPIYTDNLPKMTTDVDGWLFYDDNGPWRIDQEGKQVTLNIVLMIRYKLDQFPDTFNQVNAQEQVLKFLLSIDHMQAPPGLSFRHRQTRCFKGDNGEYVIENNIEFIQLNC